MNYKNYPLHGLLAIGVILIVTAVALLHITKQPAKAYPMFDERGRTLPNLFHGIPADQRFIPPSSSSLKVRVCRLPFARDFLGAVRRHIPFANVSAFSCGGGGGCGGHYMVDYAPPCTGSGSGCGSGYANAYYSAPGQAGYCDGSRITGNDACDGCTCEDASCNSCP